MPARVTVRYWAGAKRAAGVEHESLEIDSVAELRALLNARPALAALSHVASILVDGARVGDTAPLHDGAQLDVLPPFAGG